MLKLARVCVFLRRRTNGTVAAPPVGEVYRVEQRFLIISIQHQAYYQVAKNCFFAISTFFVTGDQKWGQTQKMDFVGFAGNFLRQALL